MSTTTSTIPTADTGPVPTDVAVQIPVEDGPTLDGLFNPFQVVRVEWKAWRFPDGMVLVRASAFGKRHDNDEIWHDDGHSDTLPAWAPAAPAWFAQVVADMRAAAQPTPAPAAVFPCGPADGGAA